mmetsp:Transcript_15694/g.26128  ORF Transcript_15694/g.26128 Transcript_15694/m.26128 type:complete len:116 (-) Transcript_15694:137-484(-)|eukprot:CAMPEP_0197725898 /NCGR_PEP_ID=MMETSP1434-20131217/11834_1 /TAXON_ID=265543 /ORGANISM="Minutocellus polymorphus, Strain CCMP3303" /LENGTH=115 /DNA_ID=CAMNT_0043311635 /DNA_START=80 /DNA_END=427 /DNA_ORIENTATION=+
MKTNVASLLLFLLVIIATSMNGAAASTALGDGTEGSTINDVDVDAEADVERMLGFGVMNSKKTSRSYWRGVYDDCCEGSKKRIKKKCDCPVRFVGRWKKKWNKSCKTTIKDRAGK